jgi:uncharacterized SAM-binding protein YcdF (DUF218 family)
MPVRWSRRLPRPGKARLGWAVALVIGIVVAAGAGAGRWLVVESVVPDPDAILVLASHEYERLPRAWQLAVQHPRATVVLSSPAVPTEHNCQACAHRVGWLVGWGIPGARIHVMETPVRNSYDELVAMAALARERQWVSVQVVTSPYHTRRVAGLVRAVVGRDGGPRFGVTSGSYGRLAPGSWWSRRYDGRYVLYEAAALVANGWRYGIWPWQWHLPER